MSIRARIRSFLGVSSILTAIAESKRALAESFYEALHTIPSEPALATVTFMGVTIDEEKMARSDRFALLSSSVACARQIAFGIESFIERGETKTLVINDLQFPVGHCCFFISGHPHLVIKNVTIGNDSVCANLSGKKHGWLGKAVGVGVHINVTIEYKREP
jgi:hypothetical protein